MNGPAAPLLDYIESAKRRDEALAQVSCNSGSWFDVALVALEQLPKQNSWANLERGFTGEFIRQALTPSVGHPHHPNAWGALIRAAIGRDLIAATGEYRPMQAVNSHGRKTPVYRWAQ